MAGLSCSQCGRAAPADADELRGWKHGELVLAGEGNESMLLCPDCVEEELAGAFEAGEPG